MAEGDVVVSRAAGFLYCPAEHLADYDIRDAKFKIIPKLCAEQKCKHCVPDRNRP